MKMKGAYYFRLWRLLRRLRAWRFAALVFTIFNVKCFPFVWHYRFFIPVLTASLRKPVEQCPAMLRRQTNGVPLVFLPIITTTRVPLLEGDFNLHKSNSTYFTDLDTSRAHLLAFLCFKGMAKLDKDLRAAGKSGILTVMLGSTQTSFKREIPTFHPYEVWSRILTWDQKWLYIVTHFVQKGKIKPTASVTNIGGVKRKPKTSVRGVTEIAKSNSLEDEKTPASSSTDLDSPIFATAISKCVFKKGRLTIAPERVLDISGLLSKVAPDSSPIDLSYPDVRANGSTAYHTTEEMCNFQLAKTIEKERLKGLKYADLLSGLEELQGQLLKDEEVSNGVISLGTFNDYGQHISH
ncbi:hypothetical protein BGW36DRAFT_379728 [Talaromyces proteolyticus]|uniref:Thioesterase n=1 Tax=Talaromyces proteolyticus TaxID=1131652 RepID=A0AAD4KS19_9EURO|nr:uncharacterized protein BGW36DRAFT_379728 [Talaromyces proteolyticus]KAH8697954.1 hypothetical protein BGW36DRAFT_379728 [Talaromyces proteolyticus]